MASIHLQLMAYAFWNCVIRINNGKRDLLMVTAQTIEQRTRNSKDGRRKAEGFRIEIPRKGLAELRRPGRPQRKRIGAIGR